MPRLPSRTHASTKRSGARHTAAKALLELSRELSACTELDAVAERVVRGAVRILEVPRASLWLPLEDDAGLECLSRWPDDDDPAYAQPGDRLPPRALQLLADKTDPFLIRSEDHLETVGPDFKRTLAAEYALAPFPIDGSHGGLSPHPVARARRSTDGGSTCSRASPRRRSSP